VPATTARLTDVGAGHHDPPEIRRGSQHPAQQLAVVRLHPSPLAQRQTRLGHTVRQFVAQLLQLTQVENPWLRGKRANSVIDLDPAECFAEEPGELMLETPDLAPQLDPGKALIGPDPKSKKAVSFEQFRHRPGSECRSRRRGRKPGTG
jgi:hypothetical protein